MDDDKKMELWDRLFPTDPSQTKTFRRSGGFSGTAIKPYWVMMRATEEFGPAGVGWGWNELDYKIFEASNGQAIWFSKIEVWYTLDGGTHRVGPQWGATELVAFRGESKSIFVDEEAAKKAITDGITKCLSYLGLAGDVHMGLFDDNKYVAERKIDERKAKEQAAREERRVEKPPPEEAKPPRKAPPGAKRAKQEVAEDPSNGEEEPPPEQGNGAEQVAKPSARAWLENVRAKIAGITKVKELVDYWDTQKPMATRVAESADSPLATAAVNLARDKMKKLREGGGV